MGHRLYDPTAGRFLSRDPARDGNNWYAYCEGDPVNEADPEGLKLINMIDKKRHPKLWREVEQAIKLIMGTERGRQLVKQLEKEGKDVYIIIGDTNRSSKKAGIIWISEYNRPQVITTEGPKIPGVPRLIAHELGHVATDLRDPDDGQPVRPGDNVDKNENGIITRFPRPLAPRIRY